MKSTSTGKLYNQRSITWASLLGGPLVGSYMYTKNFKTLGKDDEANRSFKIALILATIFFVILGLIPDNKTESIPGSALSVVNAFLFRELFKRNQAKLIAQSSNQGLTFTSVKHNLGILVLGIIATLLFGVTIILITLLIKTFIFNSL